MRSIYCRNTLRHFATFAGLCYLPEKMAEVEVKYRQRQTSEQVDKPVTMKKPTQRNDKSGVSQKPSGVQNPMPSTSKAAERSQTASGSAENVSAMNFNLQQEKFHDELMGLLSTINKNQGTQDKCLKQLETKISEYDNYYENFEGEDNYNETQDVSQVQVEDLSTLSSDIELLPESVSDNSQNIFEGIFKKYNMLDEVDLPVDSHLATLVNKVFCEGIVDEKFQKLLKETHRPENCESLVKTRVNNLVWNLLSAQIHTIDSNMQQIQAAVVNSAVIITKLISACSEQLPPNQIEAGTDALGLLGQANKLINVRRKDLHKSNLNKEYHYLCSPSQKFTDFLYGDDISKNVKEIQDVNKIGTRIKGSYQYGGYGSYGNNGYQQYRGRGRFRGVYRGRVSKPRGCGRGAGGYKPKNQAPEYSKK